MSGDEGRDIKVKLKQGANPVTSRLENSMRLTPDNVGSNPEESMVGTKTSCKRRHHSSSQTPPQRDLLLWDKKEKPI